MSSALDAGLARERLLAASGALGAGFAVVLGSVSLYGLIAYGIRLRRKELAIRAALGARTIGLFWLVSGSYWCATGGGVAVGLVLAWSTAATLAGVLHDVRIHDLTSFLASAVLTSAMAAAASVASARKVGLDDPMALRVDR
jgi:ABC-type antimicrobial peptide transport system permease subunit